MWYMCTVKPLVPTTLAIDQLHMGRMGCFADLCSLQAILNSPYLWPLIDPIQNYGFCIVLGLPPTFPVSKFDLVCRCPIGCNILDIANSARFWRGQIALEGTPFCHGNIIHVYFIRFLLVIFVGREFDYQNAPTNMELFWGILQRLKLWPKPFVHRCAKTKSALVASIRKPINELIILG